MPTFDAQSKFQKIPVAGMALENTAADLTSPVEGLTEVRTDLHQAFIYLNGAWVRLDNAGISSAPTGPAGGSLAGTYPNPSIAAGAVTTTEILDGTIANGDIANNAINSAKIADGTILVTDLDITSVRLNTIGVPTGAVNINGQVLNAVGTPVLGTDAANKNYVDNLAQGIDAKASCRVATTANITLNGAPGAIDGITPNVGDRILVKNQTDATQNGIWVMAAGAWTRATDMDTSAEFPGAFTFVESGTTQADTGWLCTVDQGFIMGTNNVTWVQFSSAGTLVAGNGLILTGNVLDINLDTSPTGGLQIVSDALGIKPQGIVNTMIADGTIMLNTKVQGTLAVANGGTSGNNPAAGRNGLSAAGIYTQTSPALTAGTWAAITHGMQARAKS